MSSAMIHELIEGYGRFNKRKYEGANSSGETVETPEPVPDMTDEDQQFIQEQVRGYYGI